MNEALGTDDGKPAVRQVGTRVVYENPWMVVREDEVERLDGSRGIYGVVDKPDFVLVIPVENDGFHLVEEYRYPIGKRTWSFPQGSLPDRRDADPEELAHLELAQETGLRAGDLTHLGYFVVRYPGLNDPGFFMRNFNLHIVCLKQCFLLISNEIHVNVGLYVFLFIDPDQQI